MIDGADHHVIVFYRAENPVNLVKLAAVARLKVIGRAAHLRYFGDETEDAVKARVVFIGLRPPDVLLGVSVNNKKLASGVS